MTNNSVSETLEVSAYADSQMCKFEMTECVACVIPTHLAIARAMISRPREFETDPGRRECHWQKAQRPPGFGPPLPLQPFLRAFVARR
jgi:hypothetical protein